MRKGFSKYEEMRKYFRFMRGPLVIYDFSTAPFWISLYMRKIWFSFLSVYYCIICQWSLEEKTRRLRPLLGGNHYWLCVRAQCTVPSTGSSTMDSICAPTGWTKGQLDEKPTAKLPPPLQRCFRIIEEEEREGNQRVSQRGRGQA